MKHTIEGHYLTPLFEPRSVALVGASENSAKVGGRILENLLAAQFDGALYAVNPKHTRIRGVPCVASVRDLPIAPDLVIVATPAASVAGVIEECGRKGTRHAVVISAGFAETGVEGARLEKNLLDVARRNRVRLIGPNCLGIMRLPIGLDATFGRGAPPSGSLALVSQSGAVCTAMIDIARANGIGFSSVVSLGGSSDIDFGEVIDYLAADARTEHILLYIEGVRQGRRLVGSLRAAARAKPVIVMKVGRHPAGSRAAVSHTGAIVGKDDIFDAVIRRTGAIRVQSLGELLAAAQALAAHVRPTGNRLAVVTNGGGPGVIAADRATDLGIPLATLSPATIAAMEKVLPSNWSHANPMDLIGDAGPDRYAAAVSACLADDGVDGILAILTPQAMTPAEDAARAVASVSQGARKPVLACWMGEESVASARTLLRAQGLPVYAHPEMAVETFAHLGAFYRNQRALLETPPPISHRELPDVATARALIAGAIRHGRTVLGAPESKALLRAFRIPVAAAGRAGSEDAAANAANAMGYPVALKIDSPDITHKSDVDGVRLGLADEAAVRGAYRDILAAVGRLRPEARVSGVSIERMVSSAHARELMVGIVRDPIFGPAITFGAGGIAIEVLRDRAVALPPLNAILVRDMIASTRVSKMLGSFRSLPAVHPGAIEALLLRVSEIACELPEVAELDINPVFADERGIIALDARVVVGAPKPLRDYGHLAVAPYPSELETRVKLADGATLLIRPIRPEDAELERAFIARLSPRSMRQRFLAGIRELTPAMLARFTQIDYDREMALVAISQGPDGDREVAVCRYITLPDGETAEYAIVVDDPWQNRGLGRLMMRRLVEVAFERGITRIVGHVATSNDAMLDLCGELGFEAEDEPGETGVKRVVATLRGAVPQPA
jgi:acetyltransferase